MIVKNTQNICISAFVTQKPKFNIQDMVDRCFVCFLNRYGFSIVEPIERKIETIKTLNSLYSLRSPGMLRLELVVSVFW